MGTHHSYSGVFSSGQTRIKTDDDLGKPGEKIANNICVLVFESLFGFWFCFFLRKAFQQQDTRKFAGNFMHIFQN